ncbi:MAG: anthranilate/aminodeoxychorismate synthase component II [Candidatus Omnitrophica bacterium]|nr:anthranilate/aminodeoxychorismate synthase component II [Candidatus Omnitrophota bacterium]
MFLLIDNYDSFTYNLYQAFLELGETLLVRRNDRITLSEVEELAPDRIILSPGPGHPHEAGISNAVIARFAGTIPVLGICLGHQCIADVFGGKIERLNTVVHGKTSPVHHNGKALFRDVENPFNAARYHSLHAVDLPDCLEITARSDADVIMGIKHREMAVFGLQFHPESFLTYGGRKILRNFTRMTAAKHDRGSRR